MLTAFILRGALFAALWWVLTEGATGGWLLASLAVISATATGVALRLPGPAGAWSVSGALRFVPFFLRQSLAGGLDVSRRALHPGLPIDPDFTEYGVSLPDDGSRVMLAAVISLLPGTLSVRLSGDRLLVHVLDRSLPAHETLRELERRIGELRRLPRGGAG
jgi:multicomponent Na+:H+ antiporter subunit E